MRVGVAATVFAIAACGDNAAPVELDVEVEGDATVALIAYRDGDGPWRVPRVVSRMGNDTFYVLQVATEYEAQVVCVGFDGLTVNTVYGMRDDTSPGVGCFYGAPAAPVTAFAVTGEMVQPGTVYMDSQDQRHTSSTTAPWSFTLQVPQGIHDLVAVPDASSPVQNVVIRRGQDVEGAIAAPTIDLAAEGVPLVRVPVTLSGAGGDHGFAETALETEHGGGALPTANGVEVFPACGSTPTATGSATSRPSACEARSLLAHAADAVRPVARAGVAAHAAVRRVLLEADARAAAGVGVRRVARARAADADLGRRARPAARAAVVVIDVGVVAVAEAEHRAGRAGRYAHARGARVLRRAHDAAAAAVEAVGRGIDARAVA